MYGGLARFGSGAGVIQAYRQSAQQSPWQVKRRWLMLVVFWSAPGPHHGTSSSHVLGLVVSDRRPSAQLSPSSTRAVLSSMPSMSKLSAAATATAAVWGASAFVAPGTSNSLRGQGASSAGANQSGVGTRRDHRCWRIALQQHRSSFRVDFTIRRFRFGCC